MGFLDRFFGHAYERELRSATPLVKEINGLEESYGKLSDTDLRASLNTLRDKAGSETDLDSLLPEAFALTREAAKRVLGVRYYDVQLVGGVMLHRGNIAEMRTGEGKTFMSTMPACLNALSGKGVHVVTVNDYLARRDAVWVGGVYHILGLTIGVINQGDSYLYDPDHSAEDSESENESIESGSFKIAYNNLKPCTRAEAYAADITYGTNNEFGFDYLRDNIEFEEKNLRQREPFFAIIDEVDSILIDEARTPLIISAPAAASENLYGLFTKVAAGLNPETDFVIDEKLKSVTLTDAGIEAAEASLGIDNIYTDRGIKYVHHLEVAVKARALYSRDKEYVVRDGEVVIVDEFTGRLQVGRRWSEGLHQAIEAKEGVQVQRESRTYASVTFQNYFRMYTKLSGMTGTGLTSQEEFFTVYGLDVMPIPTHRDVVRIDNPDFMFQSAEGKYAAVVKRVREVSETGQPILIGTASIETNEALSLALNNASVKHQMLNAKNHEQEGEIIADAGRKGAVTLATNMAGRGVDIKLGGMDATEEEAESVRSLGGLFVLGTERHEARRIDNQLRGRSGRQGDPGETQFFVSMEDELMRRFGGDRIKRLMGTFNFPEDQPIQSTMITGSLESAQKRIEGHNFDVRKQILAYDNVLNAQRSVIYGRRRRLLTGSLTETTDLLNEIKEHYPEVEDEIEAKKQEFGEEVWQSLFRRLALSLIDSLWVEHLEIMEYTRSSVSLRAYGQRDPLTEYKKEGVRLFRELQDTILYRISETIPTVNKAAVDQETKEQENISQQAKRAGGSQTANADKKTTASKKHLHGRNDLVKITDGKETRELKYKKAEILIASGAWKLVS